jgi:AraC-like DNA-binding protein
MPSSRFRGILEQRAQVMNMKQYISLNSKAENTVQGRVEILIQESLERFPILVRRNVQFMKTVKHTNPCVEIVFTHEGRAAFLSRGKLLLQKRRQVLIHNAEVPHQFIALADKSYRCTALYVDRRLTGTPIVCLDWLNQIDVCQLDLETMSYSQLMEYCRNLEELSRDKKKGWRELAIAQLLQTSVRMEHIHAQHEEQFAGVRREEISSLVQQCVEYVYDHLEEKLSLVEMAAKFSISREHLTRSFTKQLGISYHQFVMGARIDYAKQLMLDDPGLTLVEIALLAGFSTQSHFSNIFRGLTGCSPTQYRQKMNEL